MNKQKIMKWALPALLMSALTFEMMPGSVSYHAKGIVVIPEAAWSFFAPPTEGMAASCLILAGTATIIAMVLALVALCFKKKDLYKLTGWCSLAAGAFAAVPYMVATEEELLQPNVVVLLLLMASWLLAMALDKKKDTEEKAAPKGRRL